MVNRMNAEASAETAKIRLTRKSAAYWVAAFNNPPLKYRSGALMKQILGLTLAVTASLALATTASAEPLRIRGTIVATSSNSITVHGTLFGGTRTVRSMTNANVKAINPGENAPRVNSAITNASVATAKGDVRYVTLTDKGGEQNILIPLTAPVVAFVPGAPSIATSGAPVLVLSDDTNGKITPVWWRSGATV